MKQNNSNRPFSFSGFVCSTFGHQYEVSRRVTDHINEYTCNHCGKEITDTASGGLEILTVKNKQINAVLASFIERRTRRRLTAA